MIIDRLPSMPAPQAGDELPIERGTSTYKIDYTALANAINGNLGGDPVTVAHGGTGSTTAAQARENLGITPENIGAVDTDNIANNLTTTEAGYVLDARQGKALADMINSAVAATSLYNTAGPAAIISVTDGADGGVVKQAVIDVTPVQSGSGDPSPTNVRPITGWTGAEVYVSSTQAAQDGTTYPVAFPSEAGTVCGGTLTLNGDGTGELVVDRGYVEYNGSTDETWTLTASSARIAYRGILPAQRLGSGDLLTNSIPKRDTSESSSADDNIITCRGTGYVSNFIYIFAPPSQIADVSALRTYLAATPLQVAFTLATPVTYALTAPQVELMLGANNLWADCGDIQSITYPADVKLYIDGRLAALYGSGT